jgi:3-hydroxyacyl-[acyl-carrier-protein] dehydratase
MVDMDINEVLKKLPQRYPLLLVDRVLECEPGKRILALKNVSANEPYFPGHFPSRPIMPGVLILESMAQAACILAFRTLGEQVDANSVYYYAGVDKARFKRPVVPGDQLVVEVVVLARKRGLWKFSCTARVDGAVVTEAEILCTMRSVGGEGA